MDITQDSFDALLSWLDSDREIAGQKYGTIRSGLIRIFISKGFDDAEDLTDRTIDRVITTLPRIVNDYVGDPVLYFRGVARHIIQEARRRPEVTIDPPVEHFTQIKPTNERYECLVQCLELLTAPKRELILDYYLCQGSEKIQLHKALADELKISTRTVRMRVHHIRVGLEKCVSRCMAKSGRNE